MNLPWVLIIFVQGLMFLIHSFLFLIFYHFCISLYSQIRGKGVGTLYFIVKVQKDKTINVLHMDKDETLKSYDLLALMHNGKESFLEAPQDLV